MAEEKKGGRIVKDPELMAMQDASDLLDGLDQKVRKRVVEWIKNRYDTEPKTNGDQD